MQTSRNFYCEIAGERGRRFALKINYMDGRRVLAESKKGELDGARIKDHQRVSLIYLNLVLKIMCRAISRDHGENAASEA